MYGFNNVLERSQVLADEVAACFRYAEMRRESKVVVRGRSGAHPVSKEDRSERPWPSDTR